MTMPQAFSGVTFMQDRDGERLKLQLEKVKFLMLRDGKWRTLQEIALTIGAPEASVSARLRDLRKEKFGGYTVERRHIRDGLWVYRVLDSSAAKEKECSTKPVSTNSEFV